LSTITWPRRQRSPEGSTGGGIEGFAKSLTIERTDCRERADGGGIYLFNDFPDQQTGPALHLASHRFDAPSNTRSSRAEEFALATSPRRFTTHHRLQPSQPKHGRHQHHDGRDQPAVGEQCEAPLAVSSIISIRTVSAADVGIALGGVI
jgi:hypothetical protein